MKKQIKEQTGAGAAGATTSATFQPATGPNGTPSKSGAFPGGALRKKKEQIIRRPFPAIKEQGGAWIEHKKASNYKGTKAFNKTQQDSIANPKNKPITPMTGVNKKWGMSEDNLKGAMDFYKRVQATSIKEFKKK
jgi:hypothetical protein